MTSRSEKQDIGKKTKPGWSFGQAHFDERIPAMLASTGQQIKKVYDHGKKITLHQRIDAEDAQKSAVPNALGTQTKSDSCTESHTISSAVSSENDRIQTDQR